MGLKTELLRIYDKDYKKLLVIPIALILLSAGIILFHYVKTGELFERDISLKGGVSISVLTATPVDVTMLEARLSETFGQGEVSVRSLTQQGSQIGFVVDASISDQRSKELIGLIEKETGITLDQNYSVQSTGSALGESFFRDAIKAVLIAFLFMGIAVLAYFRVIVPSLFVILSAAADILGAFAVVVLLDVKLSTAGIAAFIMLIGYSVDTDVLLTSRILKQAEGTVFSRLIGALKTGLTMTMAALAVAVIGFFLAQSPTIKQIMFILMVGLVFDMINTWITNASILRWYIDRKESR